MVSLSACREPVIPSAVVRRSVPARHLGAWLLCLLLAACAPESSQSGDGSADTARDPVTGLLQGDTDGFAVADRVRAFEFPRDHGPHREYRTEWWYFTGHLAAADGRRYGFQYTIFRQAIAPAAPLPEPATPSPDPAVPASAANIHAAAVDASAQVPRSAWRTDTAWLAHLALTDVRGREHEGVARIARDALGLGAAHTSDDGRLALDVDGWRLRRAANGEYSIAAEGADEPGLRLRLRPVSEPLLQGERGLSRKGPASASYYFSIPRFEVQGQVRTAAGEWTEVAGGAWLDREWSTSALAPEQVGWDWFSLNLDDGGDLMLFRRRRRDGARDAFDAGTLRRGGVTTSLRAADFALKPLAWWQDERGRRWPVRWQVDIARPALQLQLQVDALVEDQLMRVGLEYWEGAVEVRGDARGHGYLEMTGYPPAP